MNFASMSQKDVPQGRNGKHKKIVTKILPDLDQLAPGIALKVRDFARAPLHLLRFLFLPSLVSAFFTGARGEQRSTPCP